ncbi:MAG: hypothetical protein JSV61_09230 [Anaerolineales bacterium]|nr:MAG: hypothetical protein JSV61_09230 [Anaerolineales bacterium]
MRLIPKIWLCLLVIMLLWFGYGPLSPGVAASSYSLSDPHLNPPATYFDPLPEPDGGLLSDFLPVKHSRNLLLPDLRTLPPYDLGIERLPDGSRELRLANTIWNAGAGPLELEGQFNPETRKTRVVQHIQARIGAPFDNLVGEFVWHVTHDHWHFEEFSLYELYTLTPEGKLDTVVSSSDKVSYCVIDTDVIDTEKESFSPLKRYRSCGQVLQGLSVGWGDTYKSYFDGQSLRLALVKDGYYALKSTANPGAILLESNYQNNAAILYLDIRGEQVEPLEPAEFFERRCQEYDWWKLEEIFCSI